MLDTLSTHVSSRLWTCGFTRNLVDFVDVNDAHAVSCEYFFGQKADEVASHFALYGS